MHVLQLVIHLAQDSIPLLNLPSPQGVQEVLPTGVKSILHFVHAPSAVGHSTQLPFVHAETKIEFAKSHFILSMLAITVLVVPQCFTSVELSAAAILLQEH